MQFVARALRGPEYTFLYQDQGKDWFGDAQTAPSTSAGPHHGGLRVLTLILLTWTIWRATTNASKWRMGFNSAFKWLKREA